jgi:hypothetical protein
MNIEHQIEDEPVKKEPACYGKPCRRDKFRWRKKSKMFSTKQKKRPVKAGR